MKDFETLCGLVSSAQKDLEKAEAGNRAAGTRVRKAMQEIKQAAQQVRIKIVEMRSE